MDTQFQTPILLITFNRPTHTRSVFDEIKKQKPKYLYVFQDGARENNETDSDNCAAVRAIFTESLDWECELKTNYAKTNLGCGYGPASAINWFFEQVEDGIILEDDCLPSQSFFPYCAELLEKYRYDNRIGLICGYNHLKKWEDKKNSYVFSRFGATWGWATWRRCWQYFDYKAAGWNSIEGKRKVSKMLNNDTFYKYYASEFDNYFAIERRDVWDFQWFFARLNAGFYSIIPSVNLISNVGFGNNSTHFIDNEMKPIASYELSIPLIHHAFKIDYFQDWYLFHRFINQKKRSVLKKIILKIIKIYTKTN